MFDDEERAELIVKEYGFNFDVIKKNDIISLIEQELCNKNRNGNMTLRVLCFYLFCLGDINDVHILEKAKYSSFDAGYMIDGEWIDILRKTDNESERQSLIQKTTNELKSYFRICW